MDGQRRVDPASKQVFMWQALRAFAEMVGGVDTNDQQATLVWLGNVGLIVADKKRRGQVVLTNKGVTAVYAFARAVREYTDDLRGATKKAASEAGVTSSVVLPPGVNR